MNNHHFIYFDSPLQACQCFNKYPTCTLISLSYDYSMNKYLAVYKGFYIE